jgi:hypothetical protein
MRQAEEGLAELKRAVDTMIVVPNERLLSVVGKGTSFKDALKKADEVLLHATQGISRPDPRHGRGERGLRRRAHHHEQPRRGADGHRLRPRGEPGDGGGAGGDQLAAAGQHLHPGRGRRADQHHGRDGPGDRRGDHDQLDHPGAAGDEAEIIFGAVHDST